MKSLKSTALSCIATAALVAGGLSLFPSVASASSIPTLALTSTPTTSGTGNTYDFVFDMPAGYLTLPGTGTQPIGQLTVSDGTNTCVTSTWIDEGPGSDGAGGDLLSASCAITEPESGGMIVSGTLNFSSTGEDALEGDPPLTSNSVTVGAVSAVLSINETAATSATGNYYTIIFDASTDVVPTGIATVTDSIGNSCSASNWSSGDGPDGAGGEYFSAGCYITQSESGGETVYDSYSGTDYTAADSSNYTISPLGAALSLTGSPVASPTGNSYQVTLDAPTDIAPTGTVSVTDSSSGLCTTDSWTDAGLDGSGGELFDASCPITTAEAAGATVTASYAGSDYTTSTSNTLTVVASDPYVYDAAGGVTTPASGSAPNATSITLASATTRTGYTFAGWTDGSACDGLNPPELGGLCVAGVASYQAGGTYTFYSDGSTVTFTAEWTPTTQSVTYALDGGVGTLPTQGTVATDGSFTVASGSGLSRSGYSFAGWFDGTTTYQPGQSYTMGTTAVTLTAQWASNPPSTTTTTAPPATTISISGSSPSVTYGNEATERFSVTVTGQTDTASPTGTVTVYNGSAALCTVTLTPGTGDPSSSSCGLSATELPAGSYTNVYASYTPGASSVYAASTSTALSPGLLVGRDATTTQITESKEYVVQYRETAITFTAHVSAGYGVAVPAGGKIVVRVSTASCTITLSAHPRPCTIHSSALKPGRHEVTARYYGNANLQASVSRPDRLDVTGRPSSSIK